MKILDLKPEQQAQLINNRWESSATLWDIIIKAYDRNLKIYQNKPEWLTTLPQRKSKVRANRIQGDMEAVINSLISEPAVPNMIPARQTQAAKEVAGLQEVYFKKKYEDRNGKEVIRMALRNLYFARLAVIKVFWDSSIDDFNLRSVNPKDIRVAKSARNEEESEFTIEEVTDRLYPVLKRFPKKAAELLKLFGYKDETEAFLMNPEIKYKEAWVNDSVIFMYGTLILGAIKNPYWDWDGILITEEEAKKLNSGMIDDQQELTIDGRRNLMQSIREAQAQRKTAQDQAALPEMIGQTPVNPQQPQGPDLGQAEAANGSDQGTTEAQAETGDNTLPENSTQDYPETFKQYFFNYFDKPRKPYIWGTIFNNEDSPIGQTSMIELAEPLQEGIDKRKRDIDSNCELVNGVTLVDSEVMDKSDAQQILWEAKGIIWGKGVIQGVKRETGTALPQMVFDDMVDSRNELDNIMRASSAFRGVRQGTETKAGRLALIQQSAMSLEELTQVTDYLLGQTFAWFYHLAKCRYTEYHYAKVLGRDSAVKIVELIQDDFENGAEITVIPGKTLPKDKQFQYEQAQADVEKGIISPIDYLEVAGYDNPKQTAKNAVIWNLNKPFAAGISPEEMQQIVPPPQPPPPPPPKSPTETINYKDAPEDIRRQIEAQAGLKPSTIGGTAITGSPADAHIDRALKIKNLMTPAAPPGQGAPELATSAQ